MPENTLDEQAITLELEKLRKDFIKKKTIYLVIFIPLIIMGCIIDIYVGGIVIILAILLAPVTKPARKRFINAYKKMLFSTLFKKRSN